MRHLGNAYAKGKGVKRDPGEAAAWLRKSQAAGDTEAEAALEELQSPKK